MLGKRKRKNTKLDRRDVMKKVSKTIPESALFQELAAYEKRIDTYLIQKQMVLQDALNSLTSRPTQTLNVSVYNTYSEQSGSYHIEPNSAPGIPSWTLRIEGVTKGSTDMSDKKFTSYFKKVIISLDPTIFPEDNIIEWNRTQDHSLDSDGFEVHRAGTQDTPVKILLYVAYSPPRYKLESGLSDTLNMHTDTRARIIVHLWQYIKKTGKQDEQDKKIFHLNEQLQKIFGKSTITFNELPELLRGHLAPPDPIEIDYTIRVRGEPTSVIQTYEIQVSESKQVDTTKLQDIVTIDNKISELISQIDEHRVTRDFMDAFKNNPIDLLNDLIATQAHSYKIVNSNTKEGEAVRLAGFYHQSLIRDAVAMYIDRSGNST